MLEDIVAQPLASARKGLQTRTLEAKSHIKIQGNEEINESATAASDPSKCYQEYAIGQEGLQASTGQCRQ